MNEPAEIDNSPRNEKAWRSVLFSPWPAIILIVHLMSALMIFQPEMYLGWWSTFVISVNALYVTMGAIFIWIGISARTNYYHLVDSIEKGLIPKDHIPPEKVTTNVHRFLIALGFFMVTPAVWLIVALIAYLGR